MDPITSRYIEYMYYPVLLQSLSNVWSGQQPQNVLGYYPVLPVYQSNYYNPYAQNIVEVQNMANDLQSASENLLESLNSRSASINETGLTATVESGAPLGTYQVQVNQIAKAQKNEGTWLNSFDLNFQVGENTFEITIGEETHTFTVNVESDMSNLQVLREMANQINEAEIGITATVEVEDDQARIVLEGRTGEENAFTISDVSGNLVSVSGASNITQNAQNLIYTYKGTTYESSENTFQIEEGITLTAKAAGEYTIEVGYNTEEIKNALEEFVNAYNNLAGYVEQYGAPAAVEGMLNVIKNNPMLESLGIEVQNGRLSLNEETLENNLSDLNYAENVVVPSMENLVQSGENIAEMLRNMPSYQLLNIQSEETGIFPQGFNYAEYLKTLYQYNVISTFLSVNLFNTYV